MHMFSWIINTLLGEWGRRLLVFVLDNRIIIAVFVTAYGVFQIRARYNFFQLKKALLSVECSENLSRDLIEKVRTDENVWNSVLQNSTHTGLLISNRNNWRLCKKNRKNFAYLLDCEVRRG